MSKSRKNSRKTNWKKKVIKRVLFAIALGKSFESQNEVNFAFNDKII
uniref:Ribosomal protein L32 n=1 Tax=Euglena hiemalis TaxID=392896 RepID=A0A345UC71_9EUGL|nr:ribosomal protein L32 [Euglena hiemalis]AXI98057.1 ribosomal protein L32 [Euglena hiemalis]